MAVTTWTAGQVLAAADLNDTFASKLPYSYGTATPSTTDSGFLWYDSNSTPAAPKFWDGAAFQALTSGKILQIVRATDSTNRSTTSTSLIDSNLSVTITPQKNDSAILLQVSVLAAPNRSTSGDGRMDLVITDNSNNAISGAEAARLGLSSTSTALTVPVFLSAYATPATTSATTYKLRYKSNAAGCEANLLNAVNTAEMYALEISA